MLSGYCFAGLITSADRDEAAAARDVSPSTLYRRLQSWDEAAGDVARVLPHPALILGAWLLGGLLALLGAACYAELAAAFSGTPYFRITHARDRRELQALVTTGQLKGYAVIPQDFNSRLLETGTVVGLFWIVC